MAEEITNTLLAEHHEEGTTEHQEHHSDASHEAAAQHGEASGDPFQQLYSQLGDHPGFYYGAYHVSDLPVILVDDGFHFYWNPHQMEEAGLFTLHHHKPVRVSDHEAPALDLSITNLVVFEWIAMFILVILFFRAGRAFKRNPAKAPKGLANLLEVIVVYVRDEIVRPNMPTVAVADRLLNYFVALFFFILACNLLGLIPGGHTATGSIAVTCGLAVTAFIVINFTAIKESGIGAWLKHLLGGAPWFFAPIMVPIEVLSLFIKPFALTVRLFANMSAGHIVLFSLLGILFFFNSVWISPAIIGFSVFIYLLELLVAFIQTYVFVALTAIFVGLAIGDHGHEEEHAH